MKLNILQFGKFGVIGILNTLIDFAILNLLMWLTHIYSGKAIFLLNTISFTCALINSYLLNKYWTFKEAKKESVKSQFIKFFIVSLGGILINSGIVYFGATHIKSFFNLSPHLWVNVVKVFAVAASLIWNFTGYKIFVFRNQENKIT